METEAPPKPRRGAWHDQAREMRAAGLSYDEIGSRLGVSGVAVYFAINPHKRWQGKPKKKAEAKAPAPNPAQ